MKLLLIVLLNTPILLFAQEKKIEKERRLKQSEFPSAIVKLLDPYLPQSKKIRFYEEINEHGKSFEAKVTFEGYRFSIEFSEELVLEDIEMTINSDEVPPSTLDKIRKELLPFQKSKIGKIQKQFSSDSQSPENQLSNALTNRSGDLIRYELIIHGKKEEWKTYEMLFEDDGSLISVREVVTRSADFMLY
ncbi:MAG: hypothetical protein AAF391_05595 [Bacteroidota bacterium]